MIVLSSVCCMSVWLKFAPNWDAVLLRFIPIHLFGPPSRVPQCSHRKTQKSCTISEAKRHTYTYVWAVVTRASFSDWGDPTPHTLLQQAGWRSLLMCQLIFLRPMSPKSRMSQRIQLIILYCNPPSTYKFYPPQLSTGPPSLSFQNAIPIRIRCSSRIGGACNTVDASPYLWWPVHHSQSHQNLLWKQIARPHLLSHYHCRLSRLLWLISGLYAYHYLFQLSIQFRHNHSKIPIPKWSQLYQTENSAIYNLT